MIHRIVLFAFVLLFFAATGCYHATVETGLASSTEVIEESFASSWIYGLVPPATIAAKAKCPHGVARVETQHSFVNQLVGAITLGIYTPMSIKVTCAAPGSALLQGREPDITLDSSLSEEEIGRAFHRAAGMAVQRGTPVFVRY